MHLRVAICLMLVVPLCSLHAEEAQQHETPDATQQPHIDIGEDTTVLTEPLNEQGYVDYLAWANQQLSHGVTRESNAAILFWQAFGPTFDEPADWEMATRESFLEALDLKLPAEGEYFVSMSAFGESQGLERGLLGDQYGIAVQVPWTSEQIPELANWLKANEGPLKLIVKASQRPKLYYPLVSDKDSAAPLALADRAYYGIARHSAWTLHVRALLRAGEGQTEAAVADVKSILRLARLHAGLSLMDGLLAMSLYREGLEAIEVLTREEALPPKQATELIRTLEELPAPISIRQRIDEYERYAYLDAITRMTQKGLDETLDELRKFGPLEKFIGSVDMNEALRFGNQCYDDIVAALDQPTYSEQMQALDEIESKIEEAAEQRKGAQFVAKFLLVWGEKRSKLMGRVIGELLMPMLLPAADVCRWREYQHQMHIELTQTALALSLYKDNHGKYPEELADLTPKYLSRRSRNQTESK